MRDSIVVLKFGSSVLNNHKALPSAVLEIYREIRRGRRVVAVVSAFGNRTDELLSLAQQRFTNPDPSCLARYLETGEAESAAILGMALEETGIGAKVLDAGQLGLVTRHDVLDAVPLEFDIVRLKHELMSTPVVVVPGFSGKLPDGSPALLGRGGSDLTALFLSLGLRAQECRLLKDVAGLLRVKNNGELDYNTRYATASYEECLRIGGPLIQPKAVEFAQKHKLKFTITRCGSRGGTVAGHAENTFENVASYSAATRVVLGGLGTVGLGVYRWLRCLPDDFCIEGILVEDLNKERPSDVPESLLTDSIETLLKNQPEVVIETIGGTGAAAELISSALKTGSRVVSANKQLLALNPELSALSCDNSGKLLASASVGGSVPALETVSSIARQEDILTVTGIINGTCNYILDGVNNGLEFSEALLEAQEKGMAEANPHLDISGLDCVYKLTLLAQQAFGEEVNLGAISCEGLDEISPEMLKKAKNIHGELKLVATATKSKAGIKAQVCLVVIPPHTPLFGCTRENNRLLIETAGHRQVVINGKGAGRWPTTVSVVADVLKTRRACLEQIKQLGHKCAQAS